MINSTDIRAHIFDVCIGCFFVYENDNLFARRALCGHVNSRFGFVFASIDDLLNLVNFVVLEFWEHLFDFESVYCCIRLLRFGRGLGIRLLLWVVSFLEEFGDLVDLLRSFCWNGWRDWRNVNRCDNLLIFVIGQSFGDLYGKFRFYLVPE